MPDIHIQRDHDLGLAKARKVARQWAEQAEREFQMSCTVLEGQGSDTVEFSRSGVKGELTVEATRFTLDARLGFLVGAFAKTIEAEIMRNLETLLAAHRPAAKRSAGRSVRK